MSTTQEKKLYIKTMNPSGIEDLLRMARELKPRNQIELLFQKDLLQEFAGATEKDLFDAREETGTFFFFYDYNKRRNG